MASEIQRPDIIGRFVSQHIELSDFLSENGKITLKSDADAGFAKILVLACASFFETEVVKIVENFSKSVSGGNNALCTFVKRTGLERKYHALFDWDQGVSGANKFFACFGDDSKARYKKELNGRVEMKNWVESFMAIGQTRNRLVHMNFASARLDSTYDEIYKKYQEAYHFLGYMDRHFEGLKEL